MAIVLVATMRVSTTVRYGRFTAALGWGVDRRL